MPEVTLRQADNGGTFDLESGARLVVELAEIPSTGYLWAVDQLDEQILQAEDSEFSLAPNSLVGGGGTRKLTYRARAAGTSPLHMKLWRAWMGDSSVTGRFEVTIRVVD